MPGVLRTGKQTPFLLVVAVANRGELAAVVSAASAVSIGLLGCSLLACLFAVLLLIQCPLRVCARRGVEE